MTIIFQDGNRFWIELLPISITITDAAGIVSSSVFNLERPGAFIGGAISYGFGDGTTDNMQACGALMLLDQGGGTIVLGENITGIIGRIAKQVGTSGNQAINLVAIVFLRGTGS